MNKIIHYLMNLSNITKKEILFKIPERKYISNSILRKYEGYHPYLKSRNISEEVAKIYNIGFDKDNNQIIFPIYNIEHKCLVVVA